MPKYTMSKHKHTTMNPTGIYTMIMYSIIIKKYYKEQVDWEWEKEGRGKETE